MRFKESEARSQESAWRRLSVVAVILILASCSRQSDQKAQSAAAAAKPEPIAVRVGMVEVRRVDRSIDVVGSLAPDETAAVSSEVAGRLGQIRPDFGQAVRKGDVVAELDKREFHLQLERSSASLAQALARIGLGPDQEESAAVDTPAIRQARAQYEDARSKYESAKKLVQSGDVAKERFYELEKTMETRRAAIEAAEYDLKTQLANIQALRADKRLAEKRLADATIRAPFDGIVSERHVAPWQYIKENVPIVTLVKSWPLRVRVSIPEAGAAMVHVGDAISFTADAIPGPVFTAVIRELNPSLDPRNRSLIAEARLTRADERLRPQMFVQVKVTIERNAPIVTVPKQAVYTVAGLTKLFVVDGSRAREIRFTPGQTGEDWVEVPGETVKPGDAIALEQQHQLTDGAEVRRK